MKRILTQFFGILAGCLLVNTGFAQLSATESSDANELIELLLNDNGNLTYSNASLNGATGASGTYAGADFGVSEGVILSTGAVTDAAGPNSSMATTTVNGVPGDDDLETLADQSTNDAVSLSADFVAAGSIISFSYLFASEDYNAYVCSPFSDVMAVFVDGGEYSNQNVALVPETDLLVTSNTINSGSIDDNIWGEDGCPEGGLDNSDLFIDNDGGLNYEYNGRTIFLGGEVVVTPGETYTIKWVIADGGDALFDSALLLDAGSLSSSDSECTAVGGELTVDGPTTICKSDGIDEPFTLQVEGVAGENQVFVATFLDGEIIVISEDPEFNLEGIPGNGVCLFWSLSWDGEISGAEVGLNAFDIEGDCFELSNPVEVTEYFTNGGEIATDSPTTICALDGIADPINVTLTGETGENMAWVITDADLNILDLPAGPPFDLEGAGEGLCIIWHLSWSGELEGAVVGANAGDLSGDCFDLSNPIEVTRYVADGGEISTEDPTTICALDGIADPINVTLTGETGENMAWVITDADLNILDLPAGPPFDLEGAGEGLCIIWHLSWSGELEGAVVGANAGDLSGDCFDLSNPIEVTRYVSDGGEIATDDPTTICVGDGIGDPINVTLTGETGENMAWVITDADLNILDLPAGPPFDLEGAGVGVCLIWHLSWSGELNGAAVGANAGDLSGDCFDLSNPIEVTREECDTCTAIGGELTVDGPTTVCKSDGIDEPFTLQVEGAAGENQTYVVTWDDGEIILITDNSEINLEGIPGNGTCLFWSLSWDGEISGAEVGLNAFDIEGDCFELSNPVEVTEYFTNGGEIATDSPTTICALDGIADPINVTLTGETGENMAWVITDADLNILDLPAGPPFDLEGAGEGLCIIWHLSWSGELEGAVVGANAGDLSGDCFDLSNPIEVTRYVADGGEISTEDPTTICALDGIADPINVTLTGETGENMAWVITDADLNILDLPAGPPFDLEGAGEGLCIIWHLSWSGELEGAVVGANAGDLSGDCFDLSNPIEVTRYVSDGGEIATDDPTTICVGDGIGDPINVTLTGETGENMAWVITDADLNILDLPAGPPFDLEGAGVGVCLIWHLSWSGELNGAAVGANAGDLSGDCFDLSNPIEVTREECDTCTAIGGELTVDGPTTVCKSDGIDEPFTLQVEGAAGENQTYVVTWDDGEIILITDNSEINLEGIPGNGTCLFWSLSWDGEISGAEVGLNAFDIEGDCFELSNPVEVTEYFTDGGEIATDSPTTICVGDGSPDPINVALEGEQGETMAWVITDADLNILDLPAGPPFDLDGAGVGVCLIWHLSWSGELSGAAVGENAGDLSGDCFDLSNPIEVIRQDCSNPNATNYELQTGWQPLLSVVPNPTTGFSQIVFETNETVRTSIEVYDLSGRSVQTLFSQEALSGQTYRMEFNGEGLPNGVYLVRMTNETETKFSKILIAR